VYDEEEGKREEWKTANVLFSMSPNNNKDNIAVAIDT